jgi:hypothetical protein
LGKSQATGRSEEELRTAVREFAISINSTFRRTTDMSSIIDVTSSLPLSSLAHWERLIRGEFSLALRSSATPWIIAWAKPNRFLTWVDLCSWDGYVRERTLRTLSGPAPNSFFFSLAARRINDWVPEVRLAAREKLPLLAKQSNPEHVVDAFCAMLPSWASWGRMEEVDQQVVAELLAIRGVIEALKLRLITMAVGPMSVVLSQAARTAVLDRDLADIAKHAVQPAVRATAYRAQLTGCFAWVQCRKWQWTDVRTCKGKLQNVLGERPLKEAPPFLETMALAASDRSCIVRAVAAEALVREMNVLGSAALPLARRLASDSSPRVAERAAFVLKRLLALD